MQHFVIGAFYLSSNSGGTDFLTYLETQEKNHTKKIAEIINDADFRKIITENTRKTHVSWSLIDYIITNDSRMAKVSRNFANVTGHEIIDVSSTVLFEKGA